ncbi:MAG: GTP-dependent nucleic acid-binding protein EngD [Parcubacteria group bacterium Gr01-1014_3]|nr:MAG: GTP-dependent nucleic acid-binding protein EngD [Parcubacteria group bacterium Gr01-1014_3]
MKLSIGIVGLPNVGKSTLFKILTKNEVNIANYPFCTIDPNVGVVSVPDERLDQLAKMSKSAKIIPAIVEFYDIAGLVKGANKGEGLGNQFLTHIRETDAIVMVLRVFKNEEIIHVENSVDPIRDMEIINTELALKDLESVEKLYKKAEGESKIGGTPAQKQAIKDFEAVKKIKSVLEAGQNLNTPEFAEALENEKVAALNLLSGKKQIYLLNGKLEDVSEELKKKIAERLARSSFSEGGGGYVIMDLSIATDIPELVKKAYEVLGLISFFTTGEDETRAWTIKKNSKASQAAGAIHTDFEKKFIRAEVVNWQKLLEAHSASSGQAGWSAAKQKGWMRLEGKDYIVQDGDVMEIRHG